VRRSDFELIMLGCLAGVRQVRIAGARSLVLGRIWAAGLNRLDRTWPAA